MSKTILIIEDNLANRKLVTTILQLSGYQVRSAETAMEGINIAKKETLQLILMDIQLPGMNGLDATRLLKSERRTDDIPVIALTALAMKGDEQRILDAGCDDYIAKPFDYKELLAKISAVIGTAQETESL
jgi:CheY-like chemotaxis protein